MGLKESRMKVMDVLEFLLKAGAPIKAGPRLFGPLHTLCFQTESESTEAKLDLLLWYGAFVDDSTQDDRGRTPLMYAIQFKHFVCARVLVSRGSDVNKQDDGNNNAHQLL